MERDYIPKSTPKGRQISIIFVQAMMGLEKLSRGQDHTPHLQPKI